MFIARVLDIETLRRTDTSLSTHEPLVGSSSRASCLKSTSVALTSVCDIARSTFLLLTVPSAVRAYKDLLRCNHRHPQPGHGARDEYSRSFIGSGIIPRPKLMRKVTSDQLPMSPTELGRHIVVIDSSDS